ncbi:MAG: hypothetical protein EWM72_02392 [Nitrospira sp.]|nr:MAG: hypothetical protein EWM72_02392 [Nitrospira sp.]
MHAVAEACDALGQQFVAPASIFRGEENILAGIAAQDHVVEATRNVEARFAGHWASIVTGRSLCN